MSTTTWTVTDEGYLRAHQWAAALAGGAALPQEASPVRLGPGEVAHGRFAPVGLAGFFGEDRDYRRSFLLVGGPVGLALTGAASIAHNQAKKAEAQRAAQARWHDLGTAEVVVSSQRLVLVARGKVESFWYAETPPPQWAPPSGAVPALAASTERDAAPAPDVAVGAARLRVRPPPGRGAAAGSAPARRPAPARGGGGTTLSRSAGSFRDPW
jgi:hypothetical protein